MSPEVNKYGLSRYIPPAIKRQVRQAAGFGCVCCGIGIATYEHIDPGFHEARKHDPERMAYLCGGCHDKVTRKLWSKEKILKARQEPWCLKHGRPHDAFDVSSSSATVWLGPNKIINVPIILQIEGETLIAIEPPDAEGLPYQISGKFYDNEGNLLFSIDRNEWLGELSAWDIECIGPRVTIRKEHRLIALQLRAVPPHGILVERADFRYKGTHLLINHEEFKVTSPSKAAIRILGRTIVGEGKGGVLVSVDMQGQVHMGPGPFRIEAVPFVPLNLPALPSTKIGRNDSCTCGSGKKYKKCCGQP
jgi:hypothetical protein